MVSDERGITTHYNNWLGSLKAAKFILLGRFRWEEHVASDISSIISLQDECFEDQKLGEKAVWREAKIVVIGIRNCKGTVEDRLE